VGCKVEGGWWSGLQRKARLGKGSSSGKLGMDVVQYERIIKGDRKDTEEKEVGRCSTSGYSAINVHVDSPTRCTRRLRRQVAPEGRLIDLPISPDKRDPLDRLDGLLAHQVRGDLP
jgi:hypothetical protein